MLDKIDKELRLMKTYPKKIVLGTCTYDRLISEFKSTHTYGLKVNLKGEYVKIFGMDIEIDKSRKEFLQYVV